MDLNRPDGRKTFLDEDVNGGGDDSRRGGARSVRGPAGAQGADHGKRDARRDSEGGGRRRPKRRRWRSPVNGPAAGRPSRGCSGRWCTTRWRDWPPWRSWRRRSGGLCWRRRCCALAASLADVPPDFVTGLLRERLNEGERAWSSARQQAEAAAAPAADCVSALKRRTDRTRPGRSPGRDRSVCRSSTPPTMSALAALWARKKELLRRLEALTS